jgi:hypothetical protein
MPCPTFPNDPDQAAPYNPQAWPYAPSERSEWTDCGPQRRKPSGFWRDPRTVTILRCVQQGCMSHDDAVRRLLVVGNPKSDVRWYIGRYNNRGWPPGGQGCR